MIATWYETSSPDKFGIFYQCLPNNAFHLKSDKCSGEKHSKIRITGLASAYAVGDDLPLFVIGKSKNPQYFKNVRSLQCQNRLEWKSLMDSTLFEEWVHELDGKFLKEIEKLH